MMLMNTKMKIALHTTHVPLKKVTKYITKPLLRETIIIINNELNVITKNLKMYKCVQGGEMVRTQACPALAGDVVMRRPSMAEGVLSCEQGNPGGCADGHGPSRLVSYALLGQPVEVGCLVFGSVATDPVTPQVVDHDEDDVRLLSGASRAREKEE